LLEKAFGLLGANSHKHQTSIRPDRKTIRVWLYRVRLKLPATYDILRINAMPPGRDLTTCETNFKSSSWLIALFVHDLKRNSNGIH
jgi:hypothetical protein